MVLIGEREIQGILPLQANGLFRDCDRRFQQHVLVVTVTICDGVVGERRFRRFVNESVRNDAVVVGL